MRNWLVSILIALVLSTAASAEKFTLEVVDLDKASSCAGDYSLKVIGLPEGTEYIHFELAWQCGYRIGSFEAAIASDGVLNLADYPLRTLNRKCNFDRFQWTAQAKSKSGWVPKSLGIARVSFERVPAGRYEDDCSYKDKVWMEGW